MSHGTRAGQGNSRLLMILALVAAGTAAPACNPGQQPERESDETGREEIELPTEEGASDEEAALEPALTVSPARGAPGSEVRMEAVGLPPSERIRLGAGPADSEYEIIAETRSDGDGRVDATVSVPSWAEPGDRFIFVAEAPDHRTKVLSDPFAVTEPEGRSDSGGRPSGPSEGGVEGPAYLR